MEKIDNWNSLKLKTSVLQQTPKKKRKDNAQDGEKIFAKNIFNNGLVSRIQKDVLQLNNEKTKDLI